MKATHNQLNSTNTKYKLDISIAPIQQQVIIGTSTLNTTSAYYKTGLLSPFNLE